MPYLRGFVLGRAANFLAPNLHHEVIWSSEENVSQEWNLDGFLGSLSRCCRPYGLESSASGLPGDYLYERPGRAWLASLVSY